MGDKVFVKVAQVIRFNKRGKLVVKFVGSFEILEHISKAPTDLCCQ